MAKKKTSESKFTKTAIINSKKFAEYRDLLTALLEEEQYTLEEVEKLLEKELNRKVVK